MKPEAKFDRSDPTNIGRPLYWILEDHIKAIEGLIMSDELQMAMQLCDDIPAWYRKNPPKELADIKKKLYEQLYDCFDYASDFDEANWVYADIIDQCFSNYTYPRADILAEEIKKLNGEKITPWIFEISPSHGWLPLGFEAKGLSFNFFGKNLNQKALDKIKSHLKCWAREPKPGQPKILVCFESIEHMMNPMDFVQSAHKIGVEFDQIYLSVPNGCLGGGLPDWDTRRLGHVRGWTDDEFIEFASKAFPHYSWTIFQSHSMVLKGVK